MIACQHKFDFSNFVSPTEISHKTFLSISQRNYWDMCSWKGQLEKNVKLENFKLENLEIFHLIWKVTIEVGKFSMQY